MPQQDGLRTRRLPPAAGLRPSRPYHAAASRCTGGQAPARTVQVRAPRAQLLAGRDTLCRSLLTSGSPGASPRQRPQRSAVAAAARGGGGVPCGVSWCRMCAEDAGRAGTRD